MKPKHVVSHKAPVAPHAVHKKPADNTLLIAAAIFAVILVIIILWLLYSQPAPAQTQQPVVSIPTQEPTLVATPTPTLTPTIVVTEAPTATPTPVPTQGMPRPTVQPVGAPCNNDMDCAQGWCDKTRQSPGYLGTCVAPQQ